MIMMTISRKYKNKKNWNKEIRKDMWRKREKRIEKLV